MATEASRKLTSVLIDIQQNPEDPSVKNKLAKVVKHSFFRDLLTPIDSPPVAKVKPEKAIHIWKLLDSINRDYFTAAVGHYYLRHSHPPIDFFEEVSKQFKTTTTREYKDLDSQGKDSDGEIWDSDREDEWPTVTVVDSGSISAAQSKVLGLLVEAIKHSRLDCAAELDNWAVEIFSNPSQLEYIRHPTEYDCSAYDKEECKRIFAMFVDNPIETTDHETEVLKWTQKLVKNIRDYPTIPRNAF